MKGLNGASAGAVFLLYASASVAAVSLPQDIMQACAKVYGEYGAERVTSCQQRLARERATRNQQTLDDQAREIAYKLSTYGTDDDRQIARITKAVHDVATHCSLKKLKTHQRFVLCSRSHDPDHLVKVLWTPEASATASGKTAVSLH
jgi:hypothetical protein